VREGSGGKLAGLSGYKLCYGEVTQAQTLAGRIRGCEAVIHLVGIIREFPRRGITFDRVHYEASKNVIDEAKRSGVRRFLLMSALGTRPGAQARYHQTKYQAEEYLRRSGLNYTIFRPSLIFGPEDKSINLFARMIRLSPIFMVIGDGRNLFQPVAVENVAQGVVAALTNPVAENKVYEVGGPERFTYDELLDAIGEVLGRRVKKLHLSVDRVAPLVKLLEGCPLCPLSSDQLIMLQEDNICDEKPFFQELGITPIPFREGLAAYLARA